MPALYVLVRQDQKAGNILILVESETAGAVLNADLKLTLGHLAVDIEHAVRARALPAEEAAAARHRPGEREREEALADAGRAALRRDRLGLVFQQFNLIPSLDVEDNLKFQSRIASRHDAAWHAELVERLGLDGLLKRYPEQLSGGQQQRVAIGRALAVKPLLLLADEPTGNLDEATADDVLALTRDLVKRTGCGFLMVTHSARLAATLDRQVHLSAGLIA